MERKGKAKRRYNTPCARLLLLRPRRRGLSLPPGISSVAEPRQRRNRKALLEAADLEVCLGIMARIPVEASATALGQAKRRLVVTTTTAGDDEHKLA